MPGGFELSAHMAGIFPVCSFLHVPGRMRQPLWLSLGTAFLVRPPTENLRSKTHGVALITAAHVMVPWRYIAGSEQDTMTSDDYADAARAAQQQRANSHHTKHSLPQTATAAPRVVEDKRKDVLSIPVDYRKARNIVGKLYLPDSDGRATKGHWFPLSVVAVHPTLDLCLLTVKDTTPLPPGQQDNASLRQQRHGIDCDRFKDAAKQRGVYGEFELVGGLERHGDGGKVDCRHNLVDGEESEMLKGLSERFASRLNPMQPGDGAEVTVCGVGEHVRRWWACGGVALPTDEGVVRGDGGLLWPSMADTIHVSSSASDKPATARGSRAFVVHDVMGDRACDGHTDNAPAEIPDVLSAAPCPSPDSATVLGFRGIGRLGTMDTLDPTSIENLSPSEKNAMQLEFQDVEGKQTFSTMGMRVVNGGGEGAMYGLGEVTHGEAFHGMSGGPVLSHVANRRRSPKIRHAAGCDADVELSSGGEPERACFGLFYAAAPSLPALRGMLGGADGHSNVDPLVIATEHDARPAHNAQRFAGYIPSPVIVDWLKKQ